MRLTAFTLLLALSVVWPVLFYLSRMWWRPSGDDHRALAASVRQAYRAGDVLIADPWWQARPWIALGDLPRLVLRELHPDDLLPYQRVHLIALAAAPGQGIGDELAAAYPLESSQAFGPLTHAIYRVGPAGRLLYDFSAQVRAAKVSVRYADGASLQACDRWLQDRWQCPRNPDWNFVKREWLDYDDVPRPLIWAHPVDQNGELRVRWEDVPLGGRIAGSHAFTRWAATRAAAPIELTVLVAGEQRLRQSVPVSKGLMRFSIDTAGLPARAPVEFVVRTRSNGADHYGFTALSVSEGRP